MTRQIPLWIIDWNPLEGKFGAVGCAEFKVPVGEIHVEMVCRQPEGQLWSWLAGSRTGVEDL